MQIETSEGYNSYCFSILPDSCNLLHLEEEYYSAELGEIQYHLFNIGRAPVYVEILEKTASRQNYDQQRQQLLEPGSQDTLKYKKKSDHPSALSICNKTGTRAIVHISIKGGKFSSGYRSYSPVTINCEYNRRLKKLFAGGVKYPYLNKTFKELLDAYWPANKSNFWEGIQEKLKPFLEEHTLYEVGELLNDVMKDLEIKLKLFISKFENGDQPWYSYMEIARCLIDFERKLLFDEKIYYDKCISKFLVPIYSNFVLLTVTYHALGIIYAEDIGLLRFQVTIVELGLDSITRKATKYINNMYSEWENLGYDNFFVGDIYNSMMNTRSLIAIHGLEYMAVWKNTLKHLISKETIHVPVVSYSTFFGRPTANLNKQATCFNMCPPLTPPFNGNKRDLIRSLDIHIWRQEYETNSPKIGGLQITFENGDNNYMMGTVTDQVETIEFNGAFLKKLKVTGNGGVDSCEFFLSDGRTYFFGTAEEDSMEEMFELENHNIVSLFVSSDCVCLAGQAANIAVAYCLDEDGS